MSDPFALITERLFDVVCGGRGTDGSLGTDAQARALSANRFRASAVPLSDPGISGSSYDRAVYRRWTGFRGTGAGFGPNESQYDYREIETTLDLCVGYLQGAPMSELLHLYSGEDADSAAIEPRQRAYLDSLLIQRALGFGALFQGVLSDSATRIISFRFEQQTRFEESTGGRLVHAIPCVVHAWVKNTT